MSKDKVFIVLSHKNSLKRGSTSEWEVTETVEFVDNVKRRHNSTATVIADYLNRDIIKGRATGITDYQKFEDYVRSKYGPQMKILDKQYRPEDLSVNPEGDQTAVSVDAGGAITVQD